MRIKVKDRFIKKLLLRIALYSAVIAVGLCYYFYLLHHSSGIPCLFQTLFHVKCLSCGSTAAVMAILRGDFLSAINANPLIVLLIYPALAFFILQDLYICIYCIKTKKDRLSFLQRLLCKNT